MDFKEIKNWEFVGCLTDTFKIFDDIETFVVRLSHLGYIKCIRKEVKSSHFDVCESVIPHIIHVFTILKPFNIEKDNKNIKCEINNFLYFCKGITKNTYQCYHFRSTSDHRIIDIK